MHPTFEPGNSTKVGFGSPPDEQRTRQVRPVFPQLWHQPDVTPLTGPTRQRAPSDLNRVLMEEHRPAMRAHYVTERPMFS